MLRKLPIAGVLVSLGLAGCAGTMDTITSRSMRTKPWETTQKLWSPDDPVAVLTADPPRDGNERASAMRRIKEPIRNGGSQETQDAIIQSLGRAATADPSPVLRLSAIEALGKFEDPRAASILIHTYKEAHGRPPGSKSAKPDVIPAGSGRAADRMLISDRMMLAGPVGYSPETVSAIRCRALDSLGRTNRPEAVNFLAHVATAGGESEQVPEGAEDRDVRLAAVRGLAKCRQQESVVALAQVMAKENGKDGALVGRSHDGLVKLTGKKLPPDPAQWKEIIQTGNVQVKPEPTWVEQAAQWLIP